MKVNGQMPAPPRSLTEKELERAQKEVTRGLRADEVRRRAMRMLYTDGMTQVEIAARLSRASKAAGGDDVGVDAVQKILKRMRTGVQV